MRPENSFHSLASLLYASSHSLTSSLSRLIQALFALIASQLWARLWSKPLELLSAKNFWTRFKSRSLQKLDVHIETTVPSIDKPAGSRRVTSSQLVVNQRNKASIPPGWVLRALIGRYKSCSFTSPPNGSARVCSINSRSRPLPSDRRAVFRSSLFLELRYVSRMILY